MKNVFTLCTWLIFLAGCTTVRPLTAKEVAEAKRDTLLLKQVVVNQPIRTIEVPSTHKDTVFIERLTRIEATSYLDTLALASYLRRVNYGTDTQLIALQGTILRLQDLLLKSRGKADSTRVVMQNKLDTTKQSEKRAQEIVARTERIIYTPIYIYLIFALIALVTSFVTGYLRRKLKRKQREIEMQKL